MLDPLSPEWSRAFARRRRLLTVAGLLVLGAICVLSVYTALNFDALTAEIGPDERVNAPAIEQQVVIAAWVSTFLTVAVLLRLLGVVRRPAGWVFAVAAAIGGALCLLANLGVATLSV